MEGTLVNLIIQIIAGALGGTAAGNVLKDLSMGKAGDAISGAVGGGVVGQILMAVLGGAAAPDPAPIAVVSLSRCSSQNDLSSQRSRFLS